MPRLSALVVALGLWASTSSAHAETPRIGVFFDRYGFDAYKIIEPFSPPETLVFNFYVIANLPPEHSGVERFEFALDLDPRLTVLEDPILAAGVDRGVGRDNFIVDLQGDCIRGPESWLRLVEYRVALKTYAEALSICVRPSTPSSLGRPGPVLVECGSGQATRAETPFLGCGVITGPEALECYAQEPKLRPSVPHVDAGLAELIDVPFELQLPASGSDCRAMRLHELSFRLNWDPTVIELVDVTKTPASSGLQLRKAIWEGWFRVELSGSVPLPRPQREPWLNLRFRTLAPLSRSHLTSSELRTTVSMAGRVPRTLRGDSAARGSLTTGGPFSVESFTATPWRVLEPQDITLSWDVQGSGSVSIDGIGPQPMAGTVVVRPEEETTYTLRVTEGSITRTATTNVWFDRSDSPTLQFSWSPTEVSTTPPALQADVPFDLWVLGSVPAEGMSAYQFGAKLLPEDCWTVLEDEVFPEGRWNWAQNRDPITRNFSVNVGGECLSGEVIPLARLRASTADPDCFLKGTASLGAAFPLSLPVKGPGYFACASDDFHPFVLGKPFRLETQSATQGSTSLLLPNVPNPFNPATEIRFQLALASSSRIEIFNGAGRRVRLVEVGVRNAGTHIWNWNGKDGAGEAVSSGIYHVRLTTVDGVDVRSIALVR